MAMEFFPESLKQRIQARERIGPDEALAIANQVAAALFYAHGRGFIHRDIKPDNIMFRRDGTPVILDFGIARVLESTTQLTRSGMSMGTPRYMSPEQLNAKRADGRSDIYSLGVVLYEMLSGAPPFKGSQTMTVIMKHVTEPIPPPARGAGRLPAADRPHDGQGERQAPGNGEGVAGAGQAALQALQAAQGRQAEVRRPAQDVRPGKDAPERRRRMAAEARAKPKAKRRRQAAPAAASC